MFMKMRGTDYCKRYMGDIGMSLSHSLRPLLDVITDNLKKSQQQMNQEIMKHQCSTQQ